VFGIEVWADIDGPGLVDVDDGYKCSAAKATTDSNGTRRLNGSSVIRSVFVPTMWRIASSGRFVRSSVSQAVRSVKDVGDVVS